MYGSDEYSMVMVVYENDIGTEKMSGILFSLLKDKLLYALFVT